MVDFLGDTVLKLTQKPYSLLNRVRLWGEVRQMEAVNGDRTLSHAERYHIKRIAPIITASHTGVVFDIGASRGLVSTAVCRFKSIRQVVAFEPLPKSYEELCRRSARFPVIRPINLALSDESGESIMFESSFADSSSLLEMGELHKRLFPFSAGSSEISVALRRLDDVVGEYDLAQPDFIKLDVQGAEHRVIAGGENTIRGAKDVLMELSFVELYQGSMLFDESYRYMRDLGFEIGGVLGAPGGETLQVDAWFRSKGNNDHA